MLTCTLGNPTHTTQSLCLLLLCALMGIEDSLPDSALQIISPSFLTLETTPQYKPGRNLTTHILLQAAL